MFKNVFVVFKNKALYCYQRVGETDRRCYVHSKGKVFPRTGHEGPEGK
jgi:hypothetical protein